MAYVGTVLSIPLGELALRTDAPMTSLPPNAAIKANNVDMEKSRIVKSRGASKFNSTALDAAVIALNDWFPAPAATNQRLIAGLANGEIARSTSTGSTGTFSTIHTLAATPITNEAMFVAGGAEVSGRNRKLFYFTGNNQVLVGAGDFNTMANIANPNTDWSAGNYPTGGVVFMGRLCVFGSPGNTTTTAGNKHILYISADADHEDFRAATASTAQISIFPGEGDGIVSAFVYKGFLFLFKKPLGVYAISPNNSLDPDEWTVQKLSDAFGIASPNSAVQVLDDLWAANLSGSITSLQATNAFGDVKTGDVLAINQVEEYIAAQLDPEGIQLSQCVYYAEKKRVLFTAMSAGGSVQDRIIAIDVARQIPRIRLYNAFEPNCLSLRKNENAIQKPMYGDTNGFVYLMEQDNRSVGATTPYLGEFQTPFMDFSALDQGLASKNKLFDFLEIQYLAQGNWDFMIDISIDGRFSETLTITQSVGATLDSFELDEDVLGGEPYPVPIRIPIHGSGRTISFRIYNNGLDEFFEVEKLVVSFRLSGEQQSTANAAL